MIDIPYKISLAFHVWKIGKGRVKVCRNLHIRWRQADARDQEPR